VRRKKKKGQLNFSGSQRDLTRLIRGTDRRVARRGINRKVILPRITPGRQDKGGKQARREEVTVRRVKENGFGLSR